VGTKASITTLRKVACCCAVSFPVLRTGTLEGRPHSSLTGRIEMIEQSSRLVDSAAPAVMSS